jgi:hypothetical protein
LADEVRSWPGRTILTSVSTRAIAEGRVVPLLGAGVNLSGRPSGVVWRQGHDLPSGAELAAYLAATFEFPAQEPQDLLSVAQYIAVMTGSGPLYEKLHQLFDADQGPHPPGHDPLVPAPA